MASGTSSQGQGYSQSPQSPTGGGTPSSPLNKDKLSNEELARQQDNHANLRNKYATVSMSRYLAVSLIVCASHVTAMSLMVLILLKPGGLLDLAMFRGDAWSEFLGRLLSPQLFIVCMVALAHVGIFYSLASVSSRAVASKMKVMQGRFWVWSPPYPILSGVGLCFLNYHMVQSYLAVVHSFETEEAKTEDVCPSIVGPTTLCWTHQEKMICCLAAVVLLFYYCYQERNQGFVLKYPTLDVSFSGSFRLASLKALSDTFHTTIRIVTVLYLVLAVASSKYLVTEWLRKKEIFSALLNLSFFAHSAIWPSFVLLNYNYCWNLLEATLTQKLGLPIGIQNQYSRNFVTISDAMTSDIPHLKYLGFFEFSLSVCTSSIEVKQYFTLSHPGFHPKNWTGVLNATLMECDKLTKALKEFVVWHKNLAKPTQSVLPPVESLPAATLLHQNFEKDPTIPEAIRKDIANMRGMGVLEEVLLPVEPKGINGMILMIPLVLKKLATEVFKYQWKVMVQPYIQKLRGSFENKNASSELQSVLANTQLVLWGINGLVELVQRSFQLDRHGIVQRGVGKMLHSLILLDEAVKIVDALGIPGEIPSSSKNAIPSNYNLQQLSSTIYHSLYILDQCYSPYYTTLNIPTEDQPKFV